VSMVAVGSRAAEQSRRAKHRGEHRHNLRPLQLRANGGHARRGSACWSSCPTNPAQLGRL